MQGYTLLRINIAYFFIKIDQNQHIICKISGFNEIYMQ